jgi:SAM-dependent methyltransferase
MNASEAIWHDLECGAYQADLPLWRRLADQQEGAVLEIGAGTGRVAIDLAARGHRVTALDVDADLLTELRRRAERLGLQTAGAGASISTVAADAREFELAERFGLIAVPMQTIQLLGGAQERARFLAAAAAHLQSGGQMAAALTEHFDLFDGSVEGPSSLPTADVCRLPNSVYCSQPTAVRREGQVIVLERRREILGARGPRQVEGYQVRLDRLTAAALEREGRAAGLRPLARVTVEPTPDHVGSVVVVLGG